MVVELYGERGGVGVYLARLEGGAIVVVGRVCIYGGSVGRSRRCSSFLFLVPSDQYSLNIHFLEERTFVHCELEGIFFFVVLVCVWGVVGVWFLCCGVCFVFGLGGWVGGGVGVVFFFGLLGVGGFDGCLWFWCLLLAVSCLVGSGVFCLLSGGWVGRCLLWCGVGFGQGGWARASVRLRWSRPQSPRSVQCLGWGVSLKAVFRTMPGNVPLT